MSTTAQEAVDSLWRLAGFPAALPEPNLPGSDPALPSSFRVGTAAQAAIAAAASAAAAIWQMRTGQAQRVVVPIRHAAAEFRSERYLRHDGAPLPEPWDRIAGAYRCGDGRWVRIHTNFPHHRDGFLALLDCAHDRAAVQAALEGWKAAALEEAAAQAGLPAAMMRSFAEWDAHPQGRAVAALPVLTVERVGDAPPEPFPADPVRPLSGLRALDLTRVIAGPVCGRTLAVHGAEVMLVTAAHLPAVEPLVMDTGRGKLSARLDLREAADRETLRALLRQADLFVQAYRPGTLSARGFGPEEVATLRPGIVCVSLSAYGHAGPWAGRRGFDSLVQTAAGLNAAEAEAAGETGRPRPLPCQALDHASGYLMAFGAMAALMRRATEGGSWLVRVSLAQTARWLRGLGRVEQGFTAADPGLDDVADLLEETGSGFGRLLTVRHAAVMPGTPPRWDRPSVPLGTHPAAWPAA